MGQENIWDGDTALHYDTPGVGMFAPEVLGPTVDRLAELAEGGRVLEFAIGTGRTEEGVAASGMLEPEVVAEAVMLACTQSAESRILEIQLRPMSEPLA